VGRLGHPEGRFAPEDPWVTAGLVLVGAVVGVAGAVWAVGQIAGLLFGAGAPETGLAQMPGVLGRLPSQLSDPAAAWPAGDRPRLPGPVGFYGALALLLGTLCAAAAGATRLIGRSRAPGGGTRRREVDGARWGRARDLRALLVSRPAPGRLVLGRLGRRLVATEPRASTIVVGPSQSGKTAGLAIPAILEAAGPVVAVSVKRDLLDHTLAARRRRGQVWIYDPTRAARLEDPALVGWDPVRACYSWVNARRTAYALTSAHGLAGGRDAQFWLQMAGKLIAPLLLAAAWKEGGSMRDVVRWLDTQEQNQVADVLKDIGVEEAAAAFEASCRREERTRSSVYATAEAVLEPFSDPHVLESTDAHGIDPEALLDGRSTLYVVAPAKDQERLSPLFAGLVEHLVEAAYARAAAGHPCDPPLLLVLDEAANTAPIRGLPQLAATAAGQGVQVVTVFQDLAQARSRYGEAADTILANHRAKLFLSGISDGRTLEYLGRALGDEEVAYESRTEGRYGTPSRTRGTRSRRLAPADLVRGIPPGRAVLVYGHLPPAWLSLRPWFSERGLRRLAEVGEGAQ
jgi:type IV secretion system protein VirD4